MRSAERSESARAVPASGSALSEVMVIGHKPGREELRNREPFSGPAGKLVRTMAESILVRAFLTNLVKDLDSRRTAAQKIAYGNVAGEVSKVKPRVIVTLGAEVTSYVLNEKYSIKTVHGLLLPAERFGHEFVALPLYDPGYIIRSGLQSSVYDDWVQDWFELRRVDGLRDIQASI